MKLYTIILTTNDTNRNKEFFSGVTNSQLEEINTISNSGGFKRFNVDIYDERNSKLRASNKIFKLNQSILGYNLDFFFKKNLIINS